MPTEKNLTQHLRVLNPHPNILAFFDGRVADQRFADGPNWVDDGALSLGIASYALVSGEHALVYDTHVSLEHAKAIRAHLETLGIRHITVLLSHWHLDHVAGNGAFADCEIVANEKTAAHLLENKSAIEGGSYDGPPAIAPLVMPTRLFRRRTEIEIGAITVEVLEVDIHSDDASVIWWPETGILLAGDTMEDTVTYVAEPNGLDQHLQDLDRLYALAPRRILPNHGDSDIIAAGGYGRSFIRATQQYIRTLQRCQADADLSAQPLRDLIAGPLGAGWITWFEPYEEVHRRNVTLVRR